MPFSSGDVDVRHPQLALKSQELRLLMGEPTANADLSTQPTSRPARRAELREIVATTDVWCDLIGADGKRQTVTTDQLTVQTATDADGKLYPQTVLADGDAHAFDEQQDLRAGHVELTLAPATQPATKPASKPVSRPATQPADVDVANGQIDTAAVELRSMRAWDQVRVRSADGATAAGDRMDVRMVQGQPIARITGEPMAVVTDAKKNVISGPTIDVDAARQFAAITGKGSIRAIQSPPPTTRPTTKPTTTPTTTPSIAPSTAQASPDTRPARADRIVDINWESGAELDAAKNEIRIAGPVLVSTVDADGSVVTARGERAIVELADRPPATQPSPASKPFPATQPSITQPSTTQPSGRKSTTPPPGPAGLAGAGGMDLFKNKAVTAINLQRDAKLDSTLSDSAGVLRQFEIKSDVIRFETGDDRRSATRPAALPGAMAMGEGGAGRMIVPGPGTMLYRDHRPTTRPATAPATQAHRRAAAD